MQTSKIDKYFASKGINVIFNTLGADELLVRSYVHEFHSDVENSDSKQSQYVKHYCYNKMYDIASRNKYTGFEFVKKQDQEFRSRISSLIVESQFTPTMHVTNAEQNDAIPYKEALKNKLKTITNPLLYLSGGMDSEVVACALLDLGIEFQPVVFEWVNNAGAVVNSHEVCYAYDFCKKHELVPVIEQVNVEELWSGDYFLKLAMDMQILSTHLVTYAHAVNVMSQKYPDATHMFGGEVRFQSGDVMDNGEKANLVFLNKVNPPAYDGLSYNQFASHPQNAACTLYYRNDGTYKIIGTDGVTQVTKATGTWTTTPSAVYEYRVTGAAPIDSTTGLVSYSPNVTPTSWATVGTQTSICYSSASAPGAIDGIIDCGFAIQVRVVGQTTPVVSSTIVLGAYASSGA